MVGGSLDRLKARVNGESTIDGGWNTVRWTTPFAVLPTRRICGGEFRMEFGGGREPTCTMLKGYILDGRGFYNEIKDTYLIKKEKEKKKDEIELQENRLR